MRNPTYDPPPPDKHGNITVQFGTNQEKWAFLEALRYFGCKPIREYQTSRGAHRIVFNTKKNAVEVE